MMRSFEITDLSICAPMLSFSPVFLLFVAYFLLGELPSILGFFGIITIVIGAYILNSSSTKKGIFEPFRELFRNKGVLYMFVVGFLFSITATLAKIGIKLSSPVYYMFITYSLASLIMIAIAAKK